MLTHDTAFRFASPWWLLLLLLLPLIAVLKGRKGQQSAIVFSSLHILRRMGVSTRSRAGGFRMAMVYLTLTVITLALARPQFTKTSETITESGIEMILCIDVSRSMQVEDFIIGGRRANRLEAAKKVTRDFVAGRDTDRIGLVAFSGRPYLVSPITLDHSWLTDSMSRVQIGMVEDGTAIGSAIAAATRRLDKRPAKSKVVVLLTDGANNVGKLDPIQAAKIAKTLDIKVYTIAVGTYGRYEIPTPSGMQTLEQEFDEETLQEIARIADGEYFRAQDLSSLEGVFGLIDQLEKTELKKRVSVSAKELFQIPAIAGLIFGLFSIIGAETFWRRLP